MDLDQPIAFTKRHEMMILANGKGIEENRKGIEENRKGIEENRKGIEENRKGIEENRKGIELNRKGIEANGEAITKVGVISEETRSDMRQVLEIMTHYSWRLEQQDSIHDKVERLDHRVSAIESMLTKDR